MDGDVFSFSREFLFLHVQGTSSLVYHPLFCNSSDIPILSFTTKPANIVNDLIDNLVSEAGLQLEGEIELVGTLLKAILLYLSRQFEKSAAGYLPAKRTALLNRFYGLLEQDFMSRRLTSDYAAALAISANHLNHIVKSTSGFNVGYHIQQRMILEAKKMAMLHGTSMKEIAYGLGFYDPAHFSRYFKKCTGEKFSDFRRAMGLVAGRNRLIA